MWFMFRDECCMVFMFWACWLLTLGVILCYVCVIYYILYIILYYTLYLILYSSFSSFLFSPSLISSLPLSFYLLFPFPIFFSQSQSSSHSKYTCRHLDILIYIPSVSDNLTPHVLSEWMVEVCRFYKCGILLDVLTPHVLSEVNVEWCSFNVCGLCFVMSVVWCLCFERVGYWR